MNNVYSSNSSFFSDRELRNMSFSRLGRNVKIDRSVIFIGCERISLGSNVRIDAFCIIVTVDAEIVIENGVHIAAGAKLFGSAGIQLGQFCGISSGVAIFSQSDDYSSGALTNPLVPSKLRNVKSQKVEVGSYAVVGANSVILPGVSVGRGASVGALSLVNKSVPTFMIVAGNPLRRIGMRDSRIIQSHERGIKNDQQN